VVVPKDTALEDAVEDGVTGMVFERGNVEELVGCLRRLSEDDRLVGRMSRAAYERWSRESGGLRYVQELEALYARLLA
jgi:glycosyltransferase involved in cell wall biosynthesis